MVVVFVFTFLMIFSPKLRGKMMSKQIKATRYMMNESKDDIKSVTTDFAEATKGGVETTARAIKKGLIDSDKIYCKHCGAEIDKDSKFCKRCGKEL